MNGSIDLYRKDTKDLLLQRQSAQPAPRPFVFANVDGNVINQGIEFAINYDIFNQDDLGWDIGFNIAVRFSIRQFLNRWPQNIERGFQNHGCH